MEKEVILTVEDMEYLHTEMIKMGYHNRSPKDSAKVFKRLDLMPPRKVHGREEGYEYTKNGYTTRSWTSFVKALKKFRDKGEDAGWNLIAEGDEALYFARPFQRTKGFIRKFLCYAWISKWKVDHRPLCPHCNAWMHIYRKGNRQYMWICRNSDLHPDKKFHFESWDLGLPKKAQAYIDLRRAATQYYNKKNKKENKSPTPAPFLRKPWVIMNPQNLVLSR